MQRLNTECVGGGSVERQRRKPKQDISEDRLGQVCMYTMFKFLYMFKCFENKSTAYWLRKYELIARTHISPPSVPEGKGTLFRKQYYRDLN